MDGLSGDGKPDSESFVVYTGRTSAVLAGIVLWGSHLTLTQGLLAMLVANSAPADLRGMAHRFFKLTSGLAMLFVSVLAGGLREYVGLSATFYAGALCRRLDVGGRTCAAVMANDAFGHRPLP